MKETVTVDTAILKGHKMITLPLVFVMIGSFGIVIFSIDVLPSWAFPLSFLCSCLLFPWLYWSIMITKWRLWAFENVRNVHQLKRDAIAEKLIWSDGSIFEKTEIRTKSDREKWANLQKKFLQADVSHTFQDDTSIPDETIIYYSSGSTEIIIGFILLSVGIYAVIVETIVGCIFGAIGAYTIYRGFKKRSDRTPQIILNDKGITTIDTGFYSWSVIKNASVIREGSHKNRYYYLVYEYPKGSERLDISDYNTYQGELNHLLLIYKGRYKAQQKRRG
jgi:hypothetical protein